MNFEESLQYLENSSYGHSKDFNTLKRVLALFDIKETDFKIIQIAGTNGKGTVGTFLSNIIESSNKSVGHFISPHIEDYRERFKINNKIVSEKTFTNTVELIKEKLKADTKSELTYFEISLVVALVIFKQNEVEYVILETGIGGREDITNIFSTNEISIITTIGYDHTNILGNTLEEIAYHKAGIIKENSKVVSFNHLESVDEVIEKEVIKKQSKIVFLKDEDIKILDMTIKGSKFTYLENVFETSMIGKHQVYNISLALSAFFELEISYDIKKIQKVVKKVRFEGRMEKIYSKPTIIVDGAHNSEGLINLTKNLNELNVKKYILVVGSMSDKNIIADLKVLVNNAKYTIFTKIDYERAIEPKEMVKKLELKSDYSIYQNIREVPKVLLNEKFQDDTIIITGSLYLVGEFKTLFKEK